MASTHRAPKQWCLSKTETINSFENWKQNLLYTLSLDSNFAPFLAEGFTWLKKTKAQPLRGLTDDGELVPEARRRSAQQKLNFLELMLGQIANYCPIIARSSLVKGSTSLEFVWQTIRQHYGFQVTGAHFIDFSDIHLEANERPEDLYQRLMAFIEDSLLRANGLTHHDEILLEDEELSPSLENFVVLTWLKLIHPQLPRLVKQRYGTELRSRTLASIKPEISQALESLLDEIHTTDEAKVLRSAVTTGAEPNRTPYRTRATTRPRPKTFRQDKVYNEGKCCPLCKQAGRQDVRHFLSQCQYLPEDDKRYMVKARQIVDILDEDPATEYESEPPSPTYNSQEEQVNARTVAFRVQTRQSPYLDVFHGHHTSRITIDSGATGNMIRHSTAKRLGVKVTPSSQSVHQADGSSTLKVKGETRVTFTRDKQTFHFEGLVVEDLDVEVLAGTPFMELNDIAVRPAKREVILGDGPHYSYGSSADQNTSPVARYAFLLRAPSSTKTVWPGEYLEVDLPADAPADCTYALEPRTDAPSIRRLTPSQIWPAPCIVSSVSRRIRIPNLSSEPLTLKRNEHFCQATLTFQPNNEVQPTLTAIQHKQRLQNHPFSECSKAPISLPRAVPSITVGDLVYLHSDRNKSRARDRYLVVSMESPFCNIKKFVGTQLRSSSYRVKISECFKVPADTTGLQDLPRYAAADDTTELIPTETIPPPNPPPIPEAISTPALQVRLPEVQHSLSQPEPTPITGDTDAENVNDVLTQTNTPPIQEEPRRSSRPKRSPVYLDDYVTDF